MSHVLYRAGMEHHVGTPPTRRDTHSGLGNLGNVLDDLTDGLLTEVAIRCQVVREQRKVDLDKI